MDLWNKIFPSRLKSEQSKIVGSSSPSSPSASHNASPVLHSSPFAFGLEKSGVRVLLYRECDRRGRKLLYDSQTVVRIPLPKEAPAPPQCSPSRFFRPRIGLTTKLSSSSGDKMPLGSVSPSSSGGSAKQSTSSLSTTSSNPTSIRQLGRRKISTGESYVEVRNGYGYRYLKEASDTKHIGELVFGSVALAFKGPSAKLHLMKKPSRILLSRTFKAPRSYRSTFASSDTGIDESFSSLSTSLSEFHLSKLDSSMDGSFTRSLQTNLRTSLTQDTGSGEQWYGLRASHSEEDSGFSGPSSPFSSVCGSYLNPGSLPCTPMGTPSSHSGSGSSLSKSSGSLSSLQRRFLRNVATSLESFGFASMEEDRKEERRSSSLYQTKLGLALIVETKQGSPDIERQAENWWFNQQEVLESLTNKLQIALEEAYLHRSKFVSSSFQAIEQLKQELEDLVSAPRLTDPLWLSLLSVGDCDKRKDQLHTRLVQSLTFLLNNFDTKQTNFFVSKLLTGVLTHHLGWVSSVGPQLSSSKSLSSNDKEESSCFSNTPINCTTKSLPYNALWSQLRELTGSIGFPSKVTKTVLIGDSVHKDLLNHALVVLSYLIRCSQVLENHFEEHEGGDILSGSSKSISELSSSSSTSVMTLLESNVTTTSAAATSEVSRKSSFKINRNYRQDSRTKLKRADSAKKRNSSFSTKSTEEDKHPINDDFCHKFPHSSETSKYTPFQECSSPKSNQRSGLTSSKTMGNLSLVYDLSCDTLDDSDSRILPEHPRHDSVAPEVNLKDPFLTFISSKFSGGMSEVSSCKDKLEVKVSGEEINLEIEEGGRVLFILGEDDKLEGLKPKTSRDVSPVCNTSLNESVKCTKDEVKITEDSYPKVLQSESHVEVKTLPSSEDLSKVEYFGKHGNMSLNNYPQKISLDTNKPLIPESTHKRNMSDPTNGSYLSEISSYNINSQNNKALEVVNEKDNGINYSEDSRVKKKRKRKPNEKLDNENITSESSFEEWDRLDMHSKIIDVHRINLNSQKQSRLNVAESYMGGVLDHYSSVFFLHASTDVDSHLEEKIRLDLSAAAQRPVLDTKVSEAIAIIADTEKWEVELVSSHSYHIEKRVESGSSPPISYGGIPVMISPLVSQMSDSLLNLIRIEAPPYFIAQCIEQHLRSMYLKSQLLSEYLIEGAQASLLQPESCHSAGGKSLYNLTELTHTLGIDLNDLPLLLSVASTHTPALSQMFGLSFK